MTMTDEFTDPMANPAATNAAVASILASSGSINESLPTINPPADDTVPLPGGLVQEQFGGPDVLLAKEVQVRELTGADEEIIAKARMHGNPSRFQQALLNCGVVKIGGDKPDPETLKNLLIGDQDAIILGIRRVTYGDDVVIPRFTCPGCSEQFDLNIPLYTIPIRTLDDPIRDQQFTVPLRKGGHALVRFPTGHDFEEVVGLPNATDAERNTLFLSKCVRQITNAQGDTEVMAGVRERAAAIGMADRRAILKAIRDRQPGPQYDDVKFTHTCGREVEVFLNLGDLFRDS
jgi:hypothetical protein